MAKTIFLVNLAALTVMGPYPTGVAASSAGEEGDLIVYEGDYKALSDENLLALYNKAAEIGEGKPITSFKDRETAENKIGPVLEYLATLTPMRAPKAQPAPAAGVTKPAGRRKAATTTTNSAQGAQETPMAKTKTKGAKRASKKAATTTKKKASANGLRGRKSKFAGLRITRQQKENPRRPGTRAAKAWDLIKDGMTYEAYMAAGGNLEDITREWERKRVKIHK